MKKETALLVSFTLGALLFATTALADIATKSGYEQLKDGIKKTSENCSVNFNSFTLDYSLALKDNGETLMSANEVHKFDRSMNAEENLSETKSVVQRDNLENYSYSDENMNIRKSSNDDTYYVTEYTQEQDRSDFFTDPFQEEEAKDVEKIMDALVGSLKDHVIVNENADGSKEISGSLSEIQIPALVNAVASFQMKKMFSGDQDGLPKLTEDIFVKEVNGTASINQDGIMESILGTFILSGKDSNGQLHELSAEILVKIMDVNSTIVTKPDLTGKKIEKNTVDTKDSRAGISNPEKFVGKYKNDILIEKDNKYVKVGERILDISQMDKEKVVGRYHEEYKDGFEQYADNAIDFNFEAQFANETDESDGKYIDPSSAEFEYVSQSGVKVTGNQIYFQEYNGKINFNMNNRQESGLIWDSQFSPVLE